VLITGLLTLAGRGLVVYIANTPSFGGLGKAGLITAIVVSVILIATVVWLINGTKKRD
jgi:hypothetical protein